nr:MAG TPA: hypothetical protein [Bacteriophage sp.]
MDNTFFLIFSFMFLMIFIGGIIGIISYGFAFFNPIRNHEQWNKMNWFGIIFCTIAVNVILFPYAIGYWIYKLFTVDRKEEK